MAYNNIVITLIVALVVAFVALFLASSPSYVPYKKCANYSKYEAMTPKIEEYADNDNVGGGSDESTVVEKEKLKPDGTSQELSETTQEPFEPMLYVPQTIDYAPFRDSEIIDKFSQVNSNGMDGVNGCVSSGLSNSGGYICLTPELIKLLKTRGGNATGVDVSK